MCKLRQEADGGVDVGASDLGIGHGMLGTPLRSRHHPGLQERVAGHQLGQLVALDRAGSRRDRLSSRRASQATKGRTIEFDDDAVLTWLAGQRACRHFTPAAVPVEVVRSILEVARWTGSARNGQPWRFAVVTDPSLQHRLSRLGQHAQHLASAPVVIALMTKPDAGGTDAEFDLGRLCQNITLAAAAQALGSCPATLHPTDNARAAAQLLGFEEPWQCRHAVSLGYPAPPPSGRSAITTGRRPLEELVVELRPRRSDVTDHP